MKWWKLSGQILLLFCFAWTGEWIAKQAHLPVPGSIIGIFLLLISLKFNLVKKEWIQDGADFLLKELILFSFLLQSLSYATKIHYHNMESISF